MDDYERVRKVDRLDYDVELLKTHKKECDADMEAHGKLHLQADNRMTNIEKDVVKAASGIESHDKSIRRLQDFQLRLITGGMVIGALFGFIVKLLWK